MNKQLSQWNRYFTGLLGLCLCAAIEAHGQGFGGGFGGGGFGGGTGRRSSSSTARQYPSSGMIGDALISTDPETRRVIVITDEETSQYVSQVITNLDRPKPQVLIKVVFLEVTHNDSTDIGVEGQFTKQINSKTTAAVANQFGLTPLPVPPGGGLYQMLGQDYEVTLRLIAQAGKVEILSRPSILARNNQPALITVGQSVPIVTSVRYDNFGNAIYPYTMQSVGIILRVTPFITTDGMVEMIVSPETSELADKSQWVPISTGTNGAVSAPVINTRAADTVVVTPDGQTVVIGGLMLNRKEQTETKIPVLGDIPLLGALFRHRVNNNTKTELIILLTPHVVQTSAQLAAVSEKEREAMKKSITEQQLDKFLEGLPTKEPAPPPGSSPAPPR